MRQEVDFASLVKEWAESFRSLARKRDIKLQLNIDLPEHFTLAIDVEKMERVFFNIMSNAFKHTPDNGRISFSSSADESHLSFCIKDSGSGISADQLDKIFDRFYQVDKIHPQGSGIGLSLVKAFVELHGGTITVESKPDEGAKFIVRLPILHVEQPQKAPETAIYSAQGVDNELGNVESANLDIRPDDPLLLVIDDNEDIRQLITMLMQEDRKSTRLNSSH